MITLEEARRVFSYDPETGILYRTETDKPVGGIKLGSKYEYKPYLRMMFRGKHYYVHRLIWFIVIGKWPDQVDHLNGDGLDNRWINLRETSAEGNSLNHSKQSNNTSGITGVFWCNTHKRWKASINVNCKTIKLGIFIDLLDAACARKAAEKKYGFHPNHGQERPL